MLRMRLVGELRLDSDERALDAVASKRARSLLAWLAYHPGLHPRTRVASVFWPNVLESSARASLRTTLTTLRRQAGDEASAVIHAGRDRVGIEDGPDVWIDVREAERLLAEGRLEAALELADGDLLTDLDDDWVLEERTVHRDRVAAILDALGTAAEESGDVQAAARFARRRLDLEPASEQAARALIQRLGRSGDAAAGVAAYESFRASLRRDYGMAPSAETRALVEELRSAPRARSEQSGPLPLPPALARSDHAALVGRDEQLTALRAAWKRASAGAAHVVMVSGEAGSGKTRLLTELASEVRARGAEVLAGRCMEDGMVAFAPFTEALRPHVGAEADALPEWMAAELARLLPELGAGVGDSDPGDVRHRLFEAVAGVIGRSAQRGPILLVVEDLHWADPATLQMLAHVIRTVVWAPLLVVGSLRDEAGEVTAGLHALLDDLRRERRLERVQLAGLSEAEAGDLAAAWLGEGPPAELVTSVHRRTGGNPLFIEELVRHLVESHRAEPPDVLTARVGSDVPGGVRAVIERRLSRLADPAGNAVRVAAIAGEDFTLADVARACEEREEIVAEGLEAAVSAGLVDEAGAAGRYRFAHALVRDSVLAGMTSTRRALLHRRMAEVLEELPPEQQERRLPELARHLLDARPLVDAPVAASFALGAARQALRGLAYEDAAELLERVVAGGLDAIDPLRAEVMLALGDARVRSGDAPAAERWFADAAETARALGEPELLARAALGSAGLSVTVGPVRDAVRGGLEEALRSIDPLSPLRPRLLARLAIELYYASPATLREQVSERALKAGRRTGGRALLEALGARHVALWSPDHTEERLVIAEELVAAAGASGDREAELQGINWRVADLFELGDLAGMRASIAAHEQLAAELRLPAYYWYGPMWRASLALLAGRLDEAKRISDEGERIGAAARDENAALLFETQRNAINGALGRVDPADIASMRWRAEHSPASGAWGAALGIRSFADGDLEEARRLLMLGVGGLATASLDAQWLYMTSVLGTLAARLGDAAAAAEVYPRLLPYAHRYVTVARGSYSAGSASLSLGMLAATLGDRPAASAHLEEAVRRNDDFGAVAYAAAARHALAAVVDDPDRAAALQREATSVAEALGMTLADDLFILM